eukprot:SAG11_NODE_15343_length_581_cov_1.170124_2_plen_39_part_01
MNSREVLLKLRRESYRERATRHIEQDCQRYPAPGNAWQV